MPPLPENLFALLTLIAAPAVLTNASSVLALNTANRFGRVVDRARELTAEVDSSRDDSKLRELRLSQIMRLRKRAGLLLRAQTCFYGALGLFVGAALISVLGAALGQTHMAGYGIAAYLGFLVGGAAALSLLYGCTLLVRETRLAPESLSEEALVFELRTLPASGPTSSRTAPDSF
ncbi:MAG: DUF2721 domain-containing protein [Polyangiaceae bacterium]